MKTGAFASVLVVLLTCNRTLLSVAEETDSKLLGQLDLLKASITGKYEDMRYVILQHEGLIERLERIRGNTDDWHIKMLCDVLIYHEKNPEKAVLLERKWGREFKDGIVLGGQRLPNQYGSVLRHHFGREAGPVVAEKVLHTWVFESDQTLESALGALNLLRYDFAPEVLIEAANNKANPHFALYATSLLRAWFMGNPEFESVARNVMPGSYEWPLELEHFRQDRVLLPAMHISDQRRSRLVKMMAPLLLCNSIGAQARTAYTLRWAPTKETVSLLKDRLLMDVSKDPLAEWILQWRIDTGKEIESDDGQTVLAWVRAWCADSLREIGTPEALDVLESARRSEKHPEVLEVMEGRRKPRWYWVTEGPVGSILDP